MHRRQGRPKGGLGGVSPPPTNENTSRQSDLFHYSLGGTNFTYGKHTTYFVIQRIHEYNLYIYLLYNTKYYYIVCKLIRKSVVITPNIMQLFLKFFKHFFFWRF
jgi:hypothetical protein